MTVQLGVANNHMKYTSKNNSKSLRGVSISFSFPKVGVLAYSTILISQFSHFTSKTSGFG